MFFYNNFQKNNLYGQNQEYLYARMLEILKKGRK